MLKYIYLIVFIFLMAACQNYEENRYYSLEEKKDLILSNDWYLIGLHCGGEAGSGDYNDTPMLSFNQTNVEGPHLILIDTTDLEPFTIEESNWFRQGGVGEHSLVFEYNNRTQGFTVYEVNLDRLVLIDGRSLFFKDESYCWLTLEAR